MMVGIYYMLTEPLYKRPTSKKNNKCTIRTKDLTYTSYDMYNIILFGVVLVIIRMCQFFICL